jgi:dTDP-4-dehydrorhamnose reductase
MHRQAVIFGSKGMLARALAAELVSRGIDFVGLDLPECDVTRQADIASVFQRIRPSVVFNCAAFTSVDACEQQAELANNVNGYAVGCLATMCREFGACLVHISTDFVFSGTGARPYLPTDEPAPVSAYGRSKLLGEQLLREANPQRWLIVRTAWLYGIGGTSFPRTMVELARQGKPLRVVNDQIGCPTYTEDLASAVVDLTIARARGVFHCTNSGPTSWYDFANAALAAFGVSADLQPVSTLQYLAMRPNQARRPAYSVLDCGGLEAALGRPMRPWQQALGDFRRKVQAGGGF